MADFKIDYSETPEIFFNGVRQKRLYIDSQTEPVWPYDPDEHTEVAPGETEEKWILLNDLVNLTSDDEVIFVAYDNSADAYYLINFFVDQSPYATLGAQLNVDSGVIINEIVTEPDDADTVVFKVERDGSNIMFQCIGAFSDRYLACPLNSNTGIRLNLGTDYAIWDCSTDPANFNKLSSYPYLFYNVEQLRYMVLYTTSTQVYPRTIKEQGFNSSAVESGDAIYLAKRVSGGVIYYPKTLKYAITLDANGGTIPSNWLSSNFETDWVRTTYSTLGNEYNSLPTPTKNNCSFLGWGLTPTAQKPDVFSTTAFHSDGTIYALWYKSTDPDKPSEYIEISNVMEWFGKLGELGSNADGQGFDLTPMNELKTVASSRKYLVLEDYTGESMLLYDRDDYFTGFGDDKLWYVGNFWYGLKGYSLFYNNAWELVPSSFDYYLENENIPWRVGLDVDSVWGDGSSFDYYSHGSIYYDIMEGGNKPVPQPLRLWVPYKPGTDFLVPADDEFSKWTARLGEETKERVILHAGRGRGSDLDLQLLLSVWPDSDTVEGGSQGFIFEGYLISFIPDREDWMPEIIVNAVYEIHDYSEGALLLNIYGEGALQN